MRGRKTRTDSLQRVVELRIDHIFMALAFDQLRAVDLLLQCCTAHQAQASLEVSVTYFDLSRRGGHGKGWGGGGWSAGRVGVVYIFLGHAGEIEKEGGGERERERGRDR
jgi:hypothetical protein